MLIFLIYIFSPSKWNKDKQINLLEKIFIKETFLTCNNQFIIFEENYIINSRGFQYIRLCDLFYRLVVAPWRVVG